MTARFPRDEEYLQLHLEHYQEAFAAALFTGDYTQDDFRITVEDVVPLAAAEIAVNFRVRAPVTNVPADVASIPAMAAPVLAKMTVSDLNPKIAAKGLAEALDVTGAQICSMTSTSTTPPPTTAPPTTTPPPPPPPPPGGESFDD